ncbi:MAG: hypothetical protein Q4G07_03305 [Oscillospiraceae bacterium]|nr:hypothetical protein [Oscillospiraceae bacterium]
MQKQLYGIIIYIPKKPCRAAGEKAVRPPMDGVKKAPCQNRRRLYKEMIRTVAG